MNQQCVHAVLSAVIVLIAGCAHEQPSAPSHAHWSYQGATGPEHWGSLSPDYALCSTGKQQSPIDVVSPAPADLANIAFHYDPVPVEILNNGHTVQVNYAAGSYIELDGQRYDLAQFHFHSPSEHHVAGKPAAAELHLVHKSASGQLAVVGVMLQEGPFNPGFEPVWRNLPVQESPATITADTIDADALLPSDRRTYRYEGSLTTPPGTEGVRWNLLVQPVSLSKAQLDAFRRIYHGNNRPLQPLNGRSIVQDTSP
ncbi:MAG: hypothetical protein AMXMBFR58_33630 [Phycisphaerae bacterium]